MPETGRIKEISGCSQKDIRISLSFYLLTNYLSE
ncbi:hypothetical protein BACOV975_02691 [Bacteroides ovatus V975]|nr:hypothetical protein BACOV975_02691 [Bacteroides ovatus V975]